MEETKINPKKGKVMLIWNKTIDLLKKKGITTYKIRQKNLMSQSTLAKIKMCSGTPEEINQKLEHYKKTHNGKEFKTDVNTKTIEELCLLLDCKPWDLFDWVL